MKPYGKLAVGLHQMWITKEEKDVLVAALKLLDCKAKTMQVDTASICNEERELNCVILSHLCDRLIDEIEGLFALPAPAKDKPTLDLLHEYFPLAMAPTNVPGVDQINLNEEDEDNG